MSDVNRSMMARLPLEQPHRPLDVMPVVVVFHMYHRRVAPFLDIPAEGRFFNDKPDDVPVSREFSIEDHCRTSDVRLGFGNLGW
jgi:hypothetical protein